MGLYIITNKVIQYFYRAHMYSYGHVFGKKYCINLSFYSPILKYIMNFKLFYLKLLKYYLYCHNIELTKSKLKYLQID